MQKSDMDSQQHVILEELAVLTFVIHLRELLAVRRGASFALQLCTLDQ
jgi:hypothetical protein